MITAIFSLLLIATFVGVIIYDIKLQHDTNKEMERNIKKQYEKPVFLKIGETRIDARIIAAYFPSAQPNGVKGVSVITTHGRVIYINELGCTVEEIMSRLDEIKLQK